MQRFIENALNSKWLGLSACLLLLVMFISSGLAKFIDFDGGLAEMRGSGLHSDWFFNIPSVIVLFTKSSLVLFDHVVWLGAGILSVFLILPLVIATSWLFSGRLFKTSLYFALELITVIKGLLVAAIASHFRKKDKA
ncbi:DoxX family protein [Xenorhabdus sp. 12]|uniref:DoxX family protein n=2 Tax=Xenorhabdus santafensis TaxID=2582833 RepID=A0ABU4S5J5_9GAMM|nr:DoxX family protein [Xenorhabdus sp. 12]